MKTPRKRPKSMAARFRGHFRSARSPAVASPGSAIAPKAGARSMSVKESAKPNGSASIHPANSTEARHGFHRKLEIAAATAWSVDERENKLAWIGEQVVKHSRVMGSPNFRCVNTADLIFMTELYEATFFDHAALQWARLDGLSFRWSSRMTSAGGKTTRLTWPMTHASAGRRHYEIAISSSLLFQTFQDDSREVRVCGRVCRNRLEAMQRIVEHELIHLLEMLLWTDSNCAATRFQGIVHRMFGHTEHRHELITQRERAIVKYAIRPGSRVRFQFENKLYIGVVNRITRRATVLVQDPAGIRYTDGKRYLKFYIPLNMLTLIDGV